jgi:hypothetical protein
MTLKLNGTNSEAAPAYAGDDADTGLQCGTNELKLVTGGTARATVDSDGDLGIGTASPSALLHIAKSGGNAKLLIQRSNTAANTNDYGSILWQSSAANNNALIGVARQSAENDGYMFFSTASSGTLSERMRISAEGYVTTPNQPGVYLDGLDWTNSNNYMHNGFQFWQVGSNWNNTTGTWTCPVAGKYFVGADAQGHNTHTQTGASAQYANILPHVNNSAVGLETVATSREDGTGNGGTATHTSFGFAIILSCNANDTIRVYSNHGFRTNTQNHLTIYLLG